MKTKNISIIILIATLSAGTVLAQGGPGRRGGAQYGPPKNDAERSARQEQFQKAGGDCTNDGVRNGKGKRQGKGQGDGQGQGQRKRGGARDGSGSCGGGGNCGSGN